MKVSVKIASHANGTSLGAALSPFIFVVVMDVVSEYVAKDDLRKTSYADGLCPMVGSEEHSLAHPVS